MDIEREYGGASLGDMRLTKRLPRLAEKLWASPSSSFPTILDESALEAAYRFFGNEDVTPAGILAPHIAATVRRCSELATVLVAHDTTEFGYSSKRAGMGRITEAGVGFFAHFSFALGSGSPNEPLGALNVELHTRHGPPKRRAGRHTETRPPEERESFRWRKGVDAVEKLLATKASPVHLMDREADAYELLAHMQGTKARFIVRIRANRRVESDSDDDKLFPLMDGLSGVIAREVAISARSNRTSGGSRKVHPVRDARSASLTIAAGRVTIRRPAKAPNTTEELPSELTLNVVHVRERSPPPGCAPVDWKLITNEPIRKIRDVEAVVDAYRARWLIEEFFKSLKTGCSMERRQLESLEAMTNALAIFTPMAAELLALRYLSRNAAETDARRVLRELQVEILRKAAGLKGATPSAAAAALAVARLGGHIKNNGPPGWMVLGRGYEKLLTLEAGARLALEM